MGPHHDIFDLVLSDGTHMTKCILSPHLNCKARPAGDVRSAERPARPRALAADARHRRMRRPPRPPALLLLPRGSCPLAALNATGGSLP